MWRSSRNMWSPLLCWGLGFHRFQEACPAAKERFVILFLGPKEMLSMKSESLPATFSGIRQSAKLFPLAVVVNKAAVPSVGRPAITRCRGNFGAGFPYRAGLWFAAAIALVRTCDRWKRWVSTHVRVVGPYVSFEPPECNRGHSLPNTCHLPYLARESSLFPACRETLPISGHNRQATYQVRLIQRNFSLAG